MKEKLLMNTDQQTLKNYSPNHKLVNFNVPNYLIQNFDHLVRFKRVSRTSMLIHLMEKYIRSESEFIKKDNQINKVIHDIEESNITIDQKDKENIYIKINEPEDIVEEVKPINQETQTLFFQDDLNDLSGVGRLGKL
jgi:hypothetical protein